MDRGYALLELKSVDAVRRRFSGTATTPELDRLGDIVDPAGVTFRNPVPLLLHHDQSQPVGSLTLTTAANGVTVEGDIPNITDPGTVKSRTDEAWHSIKAGILTGLSIGYRIPAGAVEYLRTGARLIKRCEIFEVSLVSIPANTAATIHAVKSLALPRRGPAMKQTATERIQSLENKRAALSARMLELMNTAADADVTLNEDEDTEWKGLDVQVKAIDNDLVKWRDVERLQVTTATPVPIAPRTPSLPVISVKSNVPIGTSFVRMACALLTCNGNKNEAAQYAAQRWDSSTPEVALALKAAVAPGTATDPAWAGPLVNQNISNEFLELLRAATIVDKIPGKRNVPFNTKVGTQTAGGTYNWVGEAKPKPVSALAFSSVALGWSKVAGIIAITEELARLSSPSAEALVRADMIAGIARFIDLQFIDPAVAVVANVHPASITNGAPTAAATANPMADIMGLINHFASNNIDVSGLTIIMSPTNALALSFQMNTDGSARFPGVTLAGGSYRGINIITSTAVGTNVVALQPNLILYADDGGVAIDVSREASLQMDSAPMSPADATTVYVSLWQNNMIGLRAERFVNWLRANANAVKYLTAAAYPAPTGELPALEPTTPPRKA